MVPSLQRRRDDLTQLVKRQLFRDFLPQFAPRLASHCASLVARCQDIQRLSAPKELADGERTLLWVGARLANLRETNITPRYTNRHYTPPAWHETEQVIDMVYRRHDGDVIEYSTVCLLLTLQSFERIPVTLDLVRREFPIYDGQISACCVAANRQLVDDQRGRVRAGVMARQVCSQNPTYFGVAHAHIIGHSRNSLHPSFLNRLARSRECGASGLGVS